MKQLLCAVLLIATSAFAQEDKLLSLLKSDASIREKADACRELARIGTREAVPVLAAMLPDEQLSYMARFALEPIADPSVDAALRQALGKVQGRQLAGVIHSLGVRKDPQAVEPLVPFLTSADPDVAQAAARALGSIGPAAAPALLRALSSGAPTNQLAVCEGLLRCAEAMSGAGGTEIYEKLRSLPNLPLQVRVAALRGAVCSRGAQGVPLLVEAIRTESSVPAADAIRISVELPGAEVTGALVGELAAAKEEKQLLLLQALGCRGDASAVPALVAVAQQGCPKCRLAAIRSLVQLASPAALPVLVALAKAPEAEVADAALTGLTGFPGSQADAALLSLLPGPETKLRVAAVQAVSQRRLTTAIPALLKMAGEPDAAVASASFNALGELGAPTDIPGVIEVLLQSREVAAAETALSAICARQSNAVLCTDQLLPGLARAQGEPKLALLRVLGTLGDLKALAAVRGAAAEAELSVRETALRVLCKWPTVEALPDLMQLAKTNQTASIKLLALRGQLRLIPLLSGSDAQKLSHLKQLLPLLERKEEQRLALAALGELPSAESLALIEPYLGDEGLKEEASVAAVAVAEKIIAQYPTEVATAMPRVQTNNKELAGRARQLLARACEAGFTPIFNGKDLSGWEGKPGWWTVQDGALTAESTPQKPCRACNYLVWRGGRPANFELLADFKLSREANSGIQLRSEERPDWDTFGYQADMTGDGQLVGFVYHHQYGLVGGRGEKTVFDAQGKKTVERIGEPAELLKQFKPGEWNTYRVVCRGADITLYLNGVLMCQITDHRVPEAARAGIIALQMHPGPPMKVQFKNIRLKGL